MPGLPDVPVIVGSTAQELDFGPTPGKELLKWSDADLFEYVYEKLAPFNETFPNISLAMYPVTVKTDFPAEYVFTTMGSDIRVNCGTDILTKKMASALTNNVYRYVVTSFPSKPVNPLGFDFPAKFAFHAWDTYAFFNGFHHVMDSSKSDEMFRDVLRENIMSFVRTGQPADSRWTPVREGQLTTALISDKLVVNASYHKAQCDFWTRNGFFSYSWIN